MDEEKETEAEGTTPIYRSEGVNASERYLKKLCEHSFLTLWSYPSVFRDQGDASKGGDGKEICDLLVVFGDHILIFSDKYCQFKNSGNLELDWSRWYRAAILDGAKQVWGAERWIKGNPTRVFLDKACTQAFPFTLPEHGKAQYHRIVVAHGAAERCKQELGGSGSLMIMADKVGSEQTGVGKGKTQFATGQIDSSKGFVHIFDDTTLDIVLQTLDTVTDFVAYLAKKEAFISSGRFAFAAGEEELLTLYLTKMNADNEHDFVLPSETSFAVLSEGSWNEYCQNPQRIAQINANRISYAWDELIEKFNKHNLAGTQHFVTHTLRDIEVAVRFLAGENRTSRRFLAEKFFEIINKTAATQRAVRVLRSLWQKDLYYVLMVFPHREDYSEEDYRVVRRTHLMHYCMVSKLTFPDASHIVGIATDSGDDEYRSEDLVYLDATDWSDDQRVESERIKTEFNLLNSVRTAGGKVQEYPDLGPSSEAFKAQEVHPPRPYTVNSRIGRNDPCHCGSGNKFKRCHGKLRSKQHENPRISGEAAFEAIRRSRPPGAGGIEPG